MAEAESREVRFVTGSGAANGAPEEEREAATAVQSGSGGGVSQGRR
jgi:hypothetical protein